MGKTIINALNGVNVSKLKLPEVLYSPDVGYTLMSIGQLNDAGFAVTFADGKCMICMWEKWKASRNSSQIWMWPTVY